MPPTIPDEDSAASTLIPYPTHPVAGRVIDTSTPRFSWTLIPSADSYRLQIAATDDFEETVHDELVDGPTTVPIDTLFDKSPSSAHWRVRAEFESGPSDWSPRAHFSVTEVDSPSVDGPLVDASPVPRHPTDRIPIDRSAASFSWKEVPEASGYQLQVATDASFESPDVDLTLDRTTSVTLYDSLPKETSELHWRVRALFANGAAGPWSRSAQGEAKPGEDLVTSTRTTSEEDGEGDSTSRRYAVAAGPARSSHTSQALSLTVALLLVVSFTATVLLIMILS